MAVGNVKHYLLDPTEAASYTATEIYGCTVLVVVDGRGVTIGHFPEESGTRTALLGRLQ